MAFLKKIFTGKDFDHKNAEKNIEKIPTDILLYIFGYLSLRDLYLAIRVSKLWYKVIMHSLNNKPSLFNTIDSLEAQVWINKVKLELTSLPLEFQKNKTLRYKNYYTTMKKTISNSSFFFTFLKEDISNPFDEIDFNHFVKKIQIYLQNYLDIPLRKLFDEDTASHINLFKYLNNADNVNTLFNSSIDCFKVILNFILKSKVISPIFLFLPLIIPPYYILQLKKVVKSL